MSLASGSIDLKSLNVAGTPNKYITKITGGDGITIHDSQNEEVNYAVINSEGMEIYQGETTSDSVRVAKFGSITTIGESTGAYLRVENNGISLKDRTLTIFQIYSEELDEEDKPTIDIFLYKNSNQISGRKLIHESGAGRTYLPNEFYFNIDTANLTLGDTITISLIWNGYFKFNASGSGSSTIFGNKNYSNELESFSFTYGTSSNQSCSKTFTYTIYGSFTRTAFYIRYDGNNQFELVSNTNYYTGGGPDKSDYVIVSSYKDIQAITPKILNGIPNVIIGPQELGHTKIDYHSLQMIDKEGNAYLYVSDLRDINGVATLTQPFEVTYAMYDEHGEVPCNVSNIIEIIDILDEDGDSLDGEATATYDSIHNRFNVSFRSNSYKGDICNIVFTTTSTQTKAFTFGTRNSNYSIGGYSAVLGYNCAATNTYSIAEGRLTRSEGYASHAEGQYSRAFGRASHAEGTGILGSTTYPYTFAYGEASHAEGCGSKAFGKASHAEGDGTVAGADASHAEGVRTQANKRGAHAEGEETIANGLSSHASGYCTNATGDYQTVIGLYNETNSNCAFIIGNGALGGPSNALTVDWYGNMVIPNGAVYRSKNSSGDERPLCGITNSNGYFYGYGSYNNNEGTSYFDGNNVKIRSNNNIDITGPVYTSSNIVLPNNISLRGKTANGNNNYSLIYASDSNNLIIGNSSWNDCYIYRVYTSGSGTVSTVPNVRILDSGRLTRTTHANSSIKIKHDIKDIENKELDPHRLYGVEVKQFIYNDDVITDKNDCRYHKEIAGFIAEQLHECYPIAVDINEKGECEAWQAQYIIPPMLKLIQEQHEEIEQLKKEVENLKYNLLSFHK